MRFFRAASLGDGRVSCSPANRVLREDAPSHVASFAVRAERGRSREVPSGIASTNTVDLVSVDEKNGLTTLSIVGPDEWPPNSEELLREKIETYVLFVQSGELSKRFPQTDGRTVEITIHLSAPPSEAIRSFVERTAHVAQSRYGIALRFFTDHSG